MVNSNSPDKVSDPMISEALVAAKLISASWIDNVAWQDFADHRYILEPKYLVQDPVPDDPFPGLLEIAIELESKGVPPDEPVEFLSRLAGLVWARYIEIEQTVIVFADRTYKKAYDFNSLYAKYIAMEQFTYAGVGADLLELYLPLGPRRRAQMMEAIVAELPPSGPIPVDIEDIEKIIRVAALGGGSLRGNPIMMEEERQMWPGRLHTFWINLVPTLKEMFEDTSPEEGLSEESVPNYGYRFQLFNFNPRIIRTIPLGPKQTERVSTKVVRRTMLRHTSEDLQATERSTDVSDTATNSTEVLREAARSLGWHAEAQGTARWGWGSAKVSAGVKGETKNRDQRATKKLSEVMRKTAGKLRTESKVIVSTETEAEFEEQTVSEIQNPNDEIPLTYVFRTLQHQFDLFTSIKEVSNVIMVAEPVPRPAQITRAWLKRYDWIIARVLLDDSYRETLNSLNLVESRRHSDELEVTLQKILQKTVGHLGNLATNSGSFSMENVDIAQEAQRGYREAVQKSREEAKRRRLERRKVLRLLQHVEDNILHYCRAIWSQEDPDQRLLRYRRLGLGIPTEWDFVLEEPDPEELFVKIENASENEEGDIVIELDGWYVANPESSVSISDIIDPSGPIGFFGNYALFEMKPEYSGENIFPMLNDLKTPYLYVEPSETEDCEAPEEASQNASTSAPVILDPRLIELKEKYAKNPPADECFVDLDTIREMVNLVPDLRVLAEQARLDDEEAKSVGQAANNLIELVNNKDLFRKYYAEYLFRKDRSRRFLLETNNLVVDIQVGEGSVMEEFKKAHREIDVEKAIAERDQLRLENRRRTELLNAGNLADPDIDKVTIVAGTDLDDGLLGIVNNLNGDLADEAETLDASVP
jgi:hypothetical protein